MTNYHVIEGESYVNVIVDDSTSYETTLRGIDAERDLAVLSICCAEFTAVPIAPFRIPSGSEIVVMGYPLGIPGEATVSKGIVSAVRYEDVEDRWVIQTDASINPGNSGGPMLSLSGEFVGIATYKIVSSGGGVIVEGVGFAISNQTLLEQLPVLVSGQAMVFPTPTPLPPTRFKLNVNGFVVGEAGVIILSGGTIQVLPTPDEESTDGPENKINGVWETRRL